MVSNNIVDYLERIKGLYTLIKQEHTGSLSDIAKKMRLSRRTIANYISELKSLGAHEERPGHIALGKDAQSLTVVHILAADAGVAAVGRIEHLVKAAHQRKNGKNPHFVNWNSR